MKIIVEDLLKLYKKSLEIRYFELTLLTIYDMGMLAGTTHTCIGQEIIATSTALFLEENDFKIGNHRSHGHYLSISNNFSGLLLEILGNKQGINKGFGGSQHIYDPDLNYYSNGIQGAFFPSAVGISSRLKETGNNIVTIFMGDGTWGEGVVYESLNLASLIKTPLLIINEDNEIAQTTPKKNNMSGDIEKRALAFDIKYIYCDSTHPIELIQKIKSSIEWVRKEKSPLILHIKSYRLLSHSKGDDTRPAELIEKIQALDPIKSIEKMIGENDLLHIKQGAMNKIEIMLRENTSFDARNIIEKVKNHDIY